MDIKIARGLIPLEKQIKFIDLPVYEVELVTDENGVERYIQTDKIIGYEKMQINLTDEELLEVAKTLIAEQ